MRSLNRKRKKIRLRKRKTATYLELWGVILTIDSSRRKYKIQNSSTTPGFPIFQPANSLTKMSYQVVAAAGILCVVTAVDNKYKYHSHSENEQLMHLL